MWNKPAVVCKLSGYPEIENPVRVFSSGLIVLYYETHNKSTSVLELHSAHVVYAVTWKIQVIKIIKG